MKLNIPILWILCAGAVHAGVADFVLVDSGAGVKPAPIIVVQSAPPRTREAAVTLAGYIEKICGSRPPILDSAPTPMPQRAIWVGYQPAIKTLLPATDFDFKFAEETLIACNEHHLAIAGRDRMAGEVQIEHGTSNAVYTFIEKHLGVRWLWPGRLGEDIPKRDTIVLAPVESRFHPPFRHRLFWPNNPVEWHRAQRLLDHSLRYEGGHGFMDWWEKYHQEHPDYFALLANGSRKPIRNPRDVKLCVSNPAVAAQWLANAEKAFHEDPARIMLSASPNDGDGFCVCPKCRAMDHPDGPPLWGYVALTDRYVKFWNILARGLKDRFPDRDLWVGAYAYSAYRTPPVAEKLEPNIAVGYVGHFPTCGEESRRSEKEQWLAWARQAKAIMYRPNLFHYSGGWLGLPTVSLRKTMEDFRFLAQHQCIGLEVDSLPNCWATQGVQFYLMAQLAYDPLQDGAAIVRDYYARGFGPAQAEIAGYFGILEDAHDAVLERIKLSSGWARQATQVYQDVYTDAVWKKAEIPLREAEAKAAAGPEIYRQRVEFVRTGFEYAKLQVEILGVMKKVRESQGRDVASVGRANQLCAARDALVKRYDGLAVRSAKWYIETRNMADYLGPPSESLGKGLPAGPAVSSGKGRD